MTRKVRRRRCLFLALSLFLIILGLSVLLYPLCTDWQYKNAVQEQKEMFEQQMEDNGVLFEELYQELKRRNEELYQEKQKDLADPFSYEQPDIDLTEYGLDGNVIGFLSIPKMEIELPILLGANTDNMRQGAVHLTETSYPIGGMNTNCVIAAHRGYAKTAMFRDIEKLEKGDIIYIRNFRETLTYRVSEISVIDPVDIERLFIQEGRDLVTLITCHPYRYNYQRYVVFCERESAE